MTFSLSIIPEYEIIEQIPEGIITEQVAIELQKSTEAIVQTLQYRNKILVLVDSRKVKHIEWKARQKLKLYLNYDEIHAIAIFGMDPIIQAIISLFIFLGPKKVRPFVSRQDALQWLIKKRI